MHAEMRNSFKIMVMNLGLYGGSKIKEVFCYNQGAGID